MKTQGMSGSQDQKETKTASTLTTFFGKKPPLRQFASTTTTNPVELMNGTTMNIKVS